MNSNNNMIELQMELPIEHEKKVFGQFDEHIKILERSLAVTLISRDGVLKIVGPASNAARAKECLTQLLELSRRGNDITTQNVNYAISLVMEDSGSSLAEIDSDCICHTVAGRPVKPKTLGQKAYVDAIREKMVVFGVGPAGTGKTYLAMAMAITAFRNDEVGRIIPVSYTHLFIAGQQKCVRYRPVGRVVTIALWRANNKPPVELVVANLAVTVKCAAVLTVWGTE